MMSCFLPRSITALLLAWLTSSATLSLQAQATDEVLTKAQDVLALPDEMAETGAKTVRLRGIVTYVTASQDAFALHDGEASVSVIVAGAAAAPEFATEVEVEGSVITEPFFEKRHACIKLSKVTVLGAGQVELGRWVVSAALTESFGTQGFEQAGRAYDGADKD
jgi:hypothetical protein